MVCDDQSAVRAGGRENDDIYAKAITPRPTDLSPGVPAVRYLERRWRATPSLRPEHHRSYDTGSHTTAVGPNEWSHSQVDSEVIEADRGGVLVRPRASCLR